jgi:hypothetical protein
MNTTFSGCGVTELDLATATGTVGGADSTDPLSEAAKELLVEAGKCILYNWDAFSTAFVAAFKEV